MKIQISTFNVNQKSLASVRPKDVAEWLLPSTNLPDLLVVGTQESLPLHEALSGVNASDNLRSTSSVVHRALSMISTSGKVEQDKTTSDDPIYVSLSQQYFSNLTLLVYARPHVASTFVRSTTHSVGFGLGGVMSNKGALSTQVQLRDGDYTFVNAHLAAHDAYTQRRNEDYDAIVTRIPSLYDTDHLFIFGDLNYRLNAHAEQKIVDLEKLATHDQLSQEKNKGSTMVGMSEGSFAQFLPTYKYHIGSIDAVNTRRTPSWTDRVLFASKSPSHCTLYDSYPNITISDHKPVSAVVIVDAEAANDISNTLAPRSINHGRLPDTNALYKAYAGAAADRLVGYTWLCFYLAGWGSSVRGAVAIAIAALTYYLVY
ncbi:hypothetical protein E3P99_03774 [Wallemia hederae]|uniref:Inositol polyphosphate-related phosphatase domain-containing protein n=1 Tax=Wallemia hederae TaxID=1540922 RepID=A0A4T0FDM0_9BASI|nr:hypothetical protein E3P99_03774 [Wallemia hederae]